MKKSITIALIVSGVVLVLLIGLMKGKEDYKYTQADIDKCLDLYLEKMEPTARDFELYDLDNNGKITLNDCVAVVKKVKGE